MIKVCEYNSANEFLLENELLLINNESLNNFILGVTNRVITHPEYGKDSRFYSIVNNNSIVGQAIFLHPKKPLAMTLLSPDEIDTLLSFFKSNETKLEGVVGPINSSHYFANNWNVPIRALGMHQGVYEVEQVKVPKLDGETLHQAKKENREICRRFLQGFIQDCFPEDSHMSDRTEEILERNLLHNKLYLLKDIKQNFVAMAANPRDSRNTATISLVYTPPNLRTQGYGSKVTALLSEHLLALGKQKCNLHTDLKNPISNSIYQRVGYKKIGEIMHYSFK